MGEDQRQRLTGAYERLRGLLKSEITKALTDKRRNEFLDCSEPVHEVWVRLKDGVIERSVIEPFMRAAQEKLGKLQMSIGPGQLDPGIREVMKLNDEFLDTKGKGAEA